MRHKATTYNNYDYKYEYGRYVKKNLFEKIHEDFPFLLRIFLYPLALGWYILKYTLYICLGLFIFDAMFGVSKSPWKKRGRRRYR